MARIGRSHIDTQGLTAEHYIGAASEHLAAAYYLRLGYQVYWPAVQADGADFIINDGDTFKRVQVKTASWSSSGRYRYLKAKTGLTNRYKFLPVEQYDILAVVNGWRMWEIPSHYITSSSIRLDTTSPVQHDNPWKPFERWLLPASVDGINSTVLAKKESEWINTRKIEPSVSN